MSSSLERLFIQRWNETASLRNCFIVPEYQFCEGRKWRFDFALPDQKIAIEIEGAIWTGGRHVTGSGYTKDIEKYNTATILGWRVLRLTSAIIKQDWESFVRMVEVLLG